MIALYRPVRSDDTSAGMKAAIYRLWVTGSKAGLDIFFRDRQADAERRADALLAAYAQLAVVSHYNDPRNGQTKPVAAGLGFTGLIAAIETVKDSRQFFR